MKKNQTLLFVLNLIYASMFLMAQNANSQVDKSEVTIDEKLKKYFNLTREEIHLHFSKDTYISNETIWLKGYVIDKSSGLLNKETTNVYISLLDAQKNVLGTKLFLSTQGVLNGSWELDKDLKSGTYYIHSFTNFMNNFEENESSLFKLEILNPKEYEVVENFDPIENATIELNVEGGNFIFGCDNKIGVKITNCKGNGIGVNNIKVLDSKSNVINQFSTNSEGYGAFEILNTQNEDYKIVIENGTLKTEKKLPNVSLEGITLSSNHFSNQDKNIIEIKTNPFTLAKIKNKKFKLLVHKNSEFFFSEIQINESNKKIVLNKENLFDGINYVRLLDENQNSISERIIYNHLNNKASLTINKVKIENDSIILKGKISNSGNLSIVTLPENTTSTFKANSILPQIKLNNYLNKPLLNYEYYFKDFDRIKDYELDLVLINQKSLKYDWTNILIKEPKTTYEFQKGVNVTVTLNQNSPTNSNMSYVGSLIIPSENTIIQEEMNGNEFNFKNVIVKDSTEIAFSLTVNDEKYDKQINNSIRVKNSFRRVQAPETNNCIQHNFIKKENENLEFPVADKSIQLKSVEIIKKRKELKFNTALNKLARGIKVDPEKEFLSLLQFIAKNGYNVVDTGSAVQIYNFGMPIVISGCQGPSIPAILIDDVLVRDLTILKEYSSYDVEEIYFNKHDDSNRGINNEVGVIRIYLRKGMDPKKIKTPGLKINKITNAFQHETPFQNPFQSDYTSDAFKKHGTIDWIPNINTDKAGNFEIKTPILNQEKILLNVQGIDSEGNLYHENILIKVKE